MPAGLRFSSCWHTAGFKSPPKAHPCAVLRKNSLLCRLAPHFVRRPLSSPARRPQPLPESNLKTVLDLAGYSKFGFVIYRTTYTPESDVLWPRFQQVMKDRARLLIADSDTPELITYLDNRFVDDRARLDGATVTTLRTMFDAWRRSPEAQAEPHATGPVYPSFSPRYNYCVRASTEVLQSVAHDAPQPPDFDLEGEGFVDFIDANWQPDNTMPEGSKCAPIEHCTEEHVGWMRLASWMMATDAYDTFCTDSMWHAFYQRPPRVVNH